MIPNFAPLIYAVDDDEDDRYLLKTVFARYHQSCFVRLFDNGSQLLTQLTHQLDGRLPDLIILDLHMPIFNGFELLRYLKQDCTYRQIPVVIMSSSQQPETIDRCYKLGSTVFIPKTSDYGLMVSQINRLKQYWRTPLLTNHAADPTKPFDWYSLHVN